MHKLQIDNENLLRDLYGQSDVIDDLRKRMDLMLKEMENVARSNELKNDDLLRHIKHLEHLLQLHNINFPRLPSFY